MNKFLLFAYYAAGHRENYEPYGGMNDYQGSFSSLGEAIEKMKTFSPFNSNEVNVFTDSQIFDVESNITYFYGYFESPDKNGWHCVETI